ncbi:nitroreductase family protein [Mycoplasmatota bacterium WC44]
MKDKSRQIAELFESKRTYRKFNTELIAEEVILNCLKVALRSPSGANLQPWTFCVVRDVELKKKLREGSEKEELSFYNNEKLGFWHNDLDILNVDVEKPFLTDAPYLICVFYHKTNKDGSNTYYASKSTGLATGMLISTLHQVGLVSLTYTPQNMDFMKKILKRPEYEMPYMILAVGKKDDSYELPKIDKKDINETVIIY